MSGRLSVQVVVAMSAAIFASYVNAATVTPQVHVNFDGVLSGTTYSLGAGELDSTGTFQGNGSATVTGGVADIPGDADASSGFYFDSTSLGDLTTQNWISEALIFPDVPPASQPGQFNHFLDVQGDLFFRFNGTPPNKVTQFGFWNGSVEPSQDTPELQAGRYSHVAVTWDGATSTLTGYINGAVIASLTSDPPAPFERPSVNVGYGFFSRTGFLNRAIDGKLDGAAFSTYTGTFDPSADFQLNVVPEPSSFALLALLMASMFGFARLGSREKS
jgi:hypothetical protein